MDKMSKNNYYETLGVARDATQEEIKASYRKLVKQLQFELGGIAYHCKKVFLANPEKYNDNIAELERKVEYREEELTEARDKFRKAGKDIRRATFAAISFLLDAVMLFHGKYFKKGVKRTFEEIGELPLSFPMEDMIMAVILAKTEDELSSNLKILIKAAAVHLFPKKEKMQPAKEKLWGTYEEMFSNWRNKMPEAAENPYV